MFLFDRERTGRMPSRLGTLQAPEVVWETTLRQFPPKGPESTAVRDAEGNLYFGCHDNCIYSLSPAGEVRWQFVTLDKVYASPVLLGDKLYFCINKAEVICLRLDGTLVWSYDGFSVLKKLPKIRRIAANLYSYWRYDYEFSKYMKINAWGSPNVLGSDTIVVNIYGAGLVALAADTGAVRWRVDLGLPYNHLAGVAITSVDGAEYIAVVAQSDALHWVDAQGRVRWKLALQRGFNAWGNPSIDPDGKAIYCTTSKNNDTAYVYKVDFTGRLLWKQKIVGGMRGTVTIARGNFVVVPTMRGELLALAKDTGNIQWKKDIATRDRGLWTSASLDANDHILINTKSAQHAGALWRIAPTGETVWTLAYGKALSVPFLDDAGHIYTATWEGKFIKLKS